MHSHFVLKSPSNSPRIVRYLCNFLYPPVCRNLHYYPNNCLYWSTCPSISLANTYYFAPSWFRWPLSVPTHVESAWMLPEFVRRCRRAFHSVERLLYIVCCLFKTYYYGLQLYNHNHDCILYRVVVLYITIYILYRVCIVLYTYRSLKKQRERKRKWNILRA